MLQHFKQLFRQECQTFEFRHEIKQIISEENHKHHIKEMARDEITYILPRETDKIVIPRVENKLNKFIINDLPTLITKNSALFPVECMISLFG